MTICTALPFVCRTNKATNTHVEYVKLISFPLQQWIHESDPMFFIRTVHFLSCGNCRSSSLIFFVSIITHWRRIIYFIIFIFKFILFYLFLKFI